MYIYVERERERDNEIIMVKRGKRGKKGGPVAVDYMHVIHKRRNLSS